MQDREVFDEKIRAVVVETAFFAAGWLVMLVPAAAGLLIYAFTDADPIPAVVYLSYFLSAYALTAVSVRIPAIWRRFRSFRRHNPLYPPL